MKARRLEQVYLEGPNQFFFVRRESDYKYNIMDANGNFILDEWHTAIHPDVKVFFKDGKWHIRGLITNSELKKNVFREDGSLVFNEWFDLISSTIYNEYSIYIVYKSDAYHVEYINFADDSGKFLLDEWIKNDEAAESYKKKYCFDSSQHWKDNKKE